MEHAEIVEQGMQGIKVHRRYSCHTWTAEPTSGKVGSHPMHRQVSTWSIFTHSAKSARTRPPPPSPLPLPLECKQESTYSRQSPVSHPEAASRTLLNLFCSESGPRKGTAYRANAKGVAWEHRASPSPVTGGTGLASSTAHHTPSWQKPCIGSAGSISA
jgi:hypothetical protein